MDGGNCESYLLFFHSFLTEKMQNWNQSCGTGKNSILVIVPFVSGEDPRIEPVCIVYSGLCNAANS